MNYGDLQAAIANVVKQADLLPEIPTWIYLCEQELNSILHRREMTQVATASTVIGQDSYELPTDFGEAVAMHVVYQNSETVLEPADWDAIKATYSTVTGVPNYWGFTQNQFMVGPTPDGVYPIKLYYYKTISNLTGANTTNWLLTNYPTVYLYGALMHAAASFVDKRSGNWVTAYKSALKILINDQIRDRGLGGGPILRADLPFGQRARGNILTGGF
jgi:hypothetical protein